MLRALFCWLGVQLLDDPLDHDGEQAGGRSKQQCDPCFFPHDVPLSLAHAVAGPGRNPDPPPHFICAKPDIR